MAARLLHGCSVFASLLVLWLLFVDTLRWSEIVAGVGAAALAAVAMESVRDETHPHFLPHARWIFEFGTIPVQILHDCWLLIGKLGRMLFARDRRTGQFEGARFEARGRDAHSAARRALATFYTTLPPNTIVIGIDRARGEMLIHRLVPTGEPDVPRLTEGRA